MTGPDSGAERRSNLHLRKIFVEACDLLKPFFDPAKDWTGDRHEHLAYRALHEQFPGLTAQEVFTLVAAARQVFHDKAVPAAG